MTRPTFHFVFDRKHVATKNNKGLVQIAISHAGKRKFVSTGVKLYAHQWHEKKRVVSSFDSAALNQLLAAIEGRILDYISECTSKGRAFSLDECARRISLENESEESFLDFMDKMIEERKDIAESTRRQHRVMFDAVVSFGKITNAESVNVTTITEFDNFLHEKNLKQVSVFGYHRRLKSYINKAYKAGIISENPYEKLSFSRGKSEERRYLTTEELGKIKAVKLNDSLSAVRDLFLFQSYTGLAYADLAKFDFKKDAKREGNKWIIKDRRTKTNEKYTIVLMKPAVEILEKYDFVLPIISNAKYNLYLKAIAAHAGIDSRLTTHVARHTFAVNAINSGVPIEVVAKMLGHTDIKTTQIYGKIVDDSVRRGYEMIEEMIQ